MRPESGARMTERFWGDMNPTRRAAFWCPFRAHRIKTPNPGLKPWASMKPILSRPAAKKVLSYFLVNFGRFLATTPRHGFGV
jgi:hypothetical protein